MDLVEHQVIQVVDASREGLLQQIEVEDEDGLISDQTLNLKTELIFVEKVDENEALKTPGDIDEPNSDNLRAYGFMSQRVKDFTDLVHITGFRCKICKFLAIDANVLKDHMDRNHKDVVKLHVLKPNDPKKYSVVPTEGMRVIVEEPVSTSWLCPVCFKTLASSQNRHMRTCHPEKCKIICKHCGLKFFDNVSLRGHVLTTHQAKQWKCDYCFKQYSVPESLEKHIKAEHPGMQKGKPCPTCQDVFPDFVQLRNHINEQHKKRSVQCEHCSNYFANRISLLNHLQELHPEKLKYQCFLCDKKFPMLSTQKKHESRVHNVGVHKCDFCEKSFLSKDWLLKHYKIAHPERTEKFPHHCRECNLRFMHAFEYQQHNLECHKSKVFPCPLCSHTYTKRHNLIIHHKSAHPEKLTFVCHLCPKSYDNNGTLERHINGAHGEKTQQCPICHKMLSARSCVKKHIKKIHMKDSVPEEVIKTKIIET